MTVLHTIKPFSALTACIYRVSISWVTGDSGELISYLPSLTLCHVESNRFYCCLSETCRRLFCDLYEKRFCQPTAPSFCGCVHSSTVVTRQKRYGHLPERCDVSSFAQTTVQYCCLHQWCYCHDVDPEKQRPACLANTDFVTNCKKCPGHRSDLPTHLAFFFFSIPINERVMYTRMYCRCTLYIDCTWTMSRAPATVA